MKVELLSNQNKHFYPHSFLFILIQTKSLYCVVMRLPMALAQS